MAPKGSWVNAPTDTKEREIDVNHKLQLYGIYSAFKNGKVPSNRQVDIALNSALDSKALRFPPPRELSADGVEVLQDIRDVIFNAKQLFLVKNQGNLLQEFIWDAQGFDRSQMSRPGVLAEKEEVRAEGTQAAEGIKTLGTLIATNGQFRKLLQDATILLRDIAGDTAQKAVSILKPSQEQLAQIDEPAEGNVWHEKPDFSKEGMKAQMKSQSGRGKGVTAGAQGGVSHSGAAATLLDGPVGTTSATPAVDGAPTGGEKTDERARARDAAERMRKFLAQKMPQERREQTLWRLKKMIVEIQGQSDYQRSVETLLELAESYGGGASQQSKESLRETAGENEASLNRLKLLLERFANSTSSEDLTDSIKNMYRKADADPQLRQWFTSFDGFIRKCLKQEGYIMTDDATREWNILHDEGRVQLWERHRDDTDRIIGELKFFGDQFDQDPLNKAFGNSMQKLFYDLGHDADGKVALTKDLRKDITEVVLPGIFANIKYLPIPRIEISDPMIDVVIENLVLEGDNMMPNVVDFSADNYWRWGRMKVGNKKDHKFSFSAYGIQTDWKDVSYYIRRKKGFPKIKDTGVMDIFMGGKGLTVRFAAASAQKKDRQHFFKPGDIAVEIHDLDIKVKKSTHKVLFTVLKPILFSVMRPVIQKVVAKQIKEAVTKADGFAYEVHQDAHRARQSARDEERQNIYYYYGNSLKKKMLERKEQKEREQAGKPKAQVNLPVTHEDSLFPDIKLPGGISNKATEYKQLAARGERWETLVFGIGSAGESTHLPRLAPITRKPHTITTTSQKREGAAAYQPTQAPAEAVIPAPTTARPIAPFVDGRGPIITDKVLAAGAGRQVPRQVPIHTDDDTQGTTRTILGTKCPVDI